MGRVGASGGVVASVRKARYTGRMQRLEEQVAHLTRTVEELSDVIARQETELSMLTRRVQMLMEREAEREQDLGGQVVLGGDERPPHW